MKVLVTGGAGFIGSHLVDKLISEGHDVFVFDDLSLGKIQNIDEKAHFIEVDLRDFTEVSRIMALVNPEIVYHLAANAAENKAQFSPVDISTRNFNTFLNTLTASIQQKVKRFIFTSSIASYGAIQAPFKESDHPEPEDLYGLAKFHAEEILKILSKVHGFEYVITRLHNVYGPRQSMTDPYRNVVALWMNSLLKGKPYVIFGKGENTRCYSYIDDVISGLVACLEAPANEIFNMGADEPYNLLQLSDAIQKVTGGTIPPEHYPDRPQEVKIAIEDHSKAKDVLGYQTTVDLEEGLRRTWEWAQKQGPQDMVYTHIELPNDKMPANWRKDE